MIHFDTKLRKYNELVECVNTLKVVGDKLCLGSELQLHQSWLCHLPLALSSSIISSKKFHDKNDIERLNNDAQDGTGDDIGWMMLVVPNPGQCRHDGKCQHDALDEPDHEWIPNGLEPRLQIQNGKYHRLEREARMSRHKTDVTVFDAIIPDIFVREEDIVTAASVIRDIFGVH